MVLLKQNPDFRGVMLLSCDSPILANGGEPPADVRAAAPDWRLRRSSAVIFLMIALMALSLSACNRASGSHRYRMIVEVDTPQGLRTGSSVVEISRDQDVAGNLHSRIRGEGVPITLQDGTIVFALLRSPTDEQAAASYALSAFSARLPDIHASTWDQRERVLRGLTGTAELRRAVYPTFVRFADRRDWRSIQALDPDRLAPGVRVRRILIEMTGDEFTNNVEALLPPPLSPPEMDAWLTSLDRLDPRYVTRSDFRSS